MDGELVASVSVVNQDPEFAFLGFYIVRPEFRGHGYGIQLWNAAIAHAGSRTIGLDGVAEQQENYERSGFAPAWRNIRFGAKISDIAITVWSDNVIDFPYGSNAEDFDAAHVAARRPEFLAEWLKTEGHIAKCLSVDGVIKACGVLRPCIEGFKVGPLFADTTEYAQSILAALFAAAPSSDDAKVYLDVPAPNAAAIEMAGQLGMEPVFETVRMYKGMAPKLDVEKIFGITTPELG